MKVEVSWAEFAEDLCERFGENSMMDVIEEFNKLRQEGSVADYQIRFEELRSLMWSSQLALAEHYFVSNFISGLKEELRLMVKMMQLVTVKRAAETKLQELALEMIFSKITIAAVTQPMFFQPLEGNQVKCEF